MSTPANCNIAMSELLKQAGSTLETAAVNWLKGVLTVTNITKCLNETGEKIEDDVKRANKKHKQTKCPPTSDSSGTPANNNKRAETPQLQQPNHIEYPSSFRENVSMGKSADPVNWNLAERKSVVQRWQPQAVVAPAA